MTENHPRVTLVVVNYNGADDTIACLAGVQRLEWPTEALAVVVVDNASAGDDADRIAAAHPGATVIRSGTNLGFAGACNLGARRTSSPYVAFVNNDARPAPEFLTAAIGALEAHPDVGAVAAKVLDWEGANVDYVGAALSWYGQAFKTHVGEVDDGRFDVPRDVLFGTGSALVVRRSAFEAVGCFDESYFMFFEDVDLGWRLWLAGHRVRYVPTALVHHRHHASMAKLGPWREQFLLERNALFTIYKNYGDENLARMLAPALALAVRRGVVLADADGDSLDLARVPPVPAEAGETTVRKTLLASTYAVDAFVRSLGSLADRRREVQAGRVRGDAEVLRLFGTPLVPNIDAPAFTRDFATVSQVFDVERSFGQRRRVLVLTGDTLASRMAGPAIRALHIARALADEHEVTLGTTSTCSLRDSDVDIVRIANQRDMKRWESWADVIIFQGYLMHEYPVLRTSAKPIVVDMYDPFHLEQLEQARDLGERERQTVVESATAVLNEQIQRGDFFLCASPKQRDFWLGQMAGLGRLNPAVYDQDESLESLIAVVPFGVEDSPPVATTPAVKGVIPGIGSDDKVILWGGGIYNWFDPLTLIKAMAVVRDRVPEARLLFMGVKHPNPAVPEMRMAAQAMDLARSLGLLGTTVVFNHEWVPYERRQDFLLESDIGVSTHLEHVETAFSFRTRILDYFWASLPVICTAGDSLADLIDAEGLGIVVPPDDVEALADALTVMLTDTDRAAEVRRRIAARAPSMTWSTVLRPVVDFCRDPRRAADLSAGGATGLRGGRRLPSVTAHPWTGVRGDVELFRRYLADEGLRGLSERVAGRLARLARGRLRQPAGG